MNRCHVCPGLEKLSGLHGCERIKIEGWRLGESWRWIVDVVTDRRAGHGNESSLDDAMNDAIGQAIRESGE